MSIRAMNWAWEQDVAPSTKLILLALADHADNDGVCWPGVKSVAEKCRLSKQSVRYHIRALIERGLVGSTPRVRKNKSQTSNSYHLGIDGLMTPYQDINTPLSTDVQGGLKLVDTPEPSIETPVNSLSLISDEEKEIWPDWYSTLYAMPGFKRSLYDCQTWMNGQAVSEDLAETTAYALKGKWPGPTRSPYRDVWATFQGWCRLAVARNGAPTNGTSEEPIFRARGVRN